MESHYVSQLLLRRFSKDNKVEVRNINMGTSKLKSPDEVAYINLSSDIFGDSEKKWANKYEGKLHEAYNLLERGSLLENRKHTEFIKAFMALLYVRSLSSYVLLGKKAHEKWNELRSELNFLNSVSETTSKNNFFDLVKTNTPSTLNTLIKKVKKEFGSYSLEIGESDSQSKFILSDVPVITRHEDSSVGILNGVGVHNSEFIFLPLSPKHIASLSATSQQISYVQLKSNAVASINQLSRKIAVKEIYVQPD